MTTIEKIKEEARFIVDKNATVRQAAERFKVSKSTIHTHITDKLQKADPMLYKKVRKVLDTNKAERHLRGGMATKARWEKK